MWRDVAPPKAVIIEAAECPGVAEVTLEDLALWAVRALEVSPQADAGLCLEVGTKPVTWHPQPPSRPPPPVSRPQQMGCKTHVPHHPATLLQGSPSGAVASWLKRKQEAPSASKPDPEYAPPLAWKRRTFGGRSFLLWVEDAGEHSAAVVYACDEGTGACGNLELPDDVLQPSFWNFVQGSTCGLLSELRRPAASEGHSHCPKSSCSLQKLCRTDECTRHQGSCQDRSATWNGRKAAIFSCNELLGPTLSVNHEHLFDEFLLSLLDAVYFEANPFGDEWSIRLPGLGPRSRAEALGEGFGPAIALASSPGARPTRWPKWLNEQESQIIQRQSIRHIGHPALASRPWRRTQVVDDSSGRPYDFSSDPSICSASASTGMPLVARLRGLRDRDEGRCTAAPIQDYEDLSLRASRCEDHTYAHLADVADDGGTGATKDNMSQPSWIPPLHHLECFSHAGYLNSAHADWPTTVQGAPGGHARKKLRSRSVGARRHSLGGRRTSLGQTAQTCSASFLGDGMADSVDARPVAGTGGVDSLHASLSSPQSSQSESCSQPPRPCSATVRPGIRHTDGEQTPLHPHGRRTLKSRLRFPQGPAMASAYQLKSPEQCLAEK